MTDSLRYYRLGLLRRAAIACILVWALGGVAAESPAEPGAATAVDLSASVTLQDLLRLGAERNPGVQAARSRWRAAIAKVPQAVALPDPTLMIDYFGENVETRVGPQEWRLALSQGFPWPGTLAQAGEVAARDVRIQHMEYDRVVRDLIVDLKVSYHELLYLRNAMTITHQNQDLLQHVLTLATTRYAAGEAKLADVLRAQSQLAQLSYDLVLLRELEQVETARILALVDLPGSQTLGVAEMPRVALLQADYRDLEAAALDGRQEIAIAQGRVDKAAESIRLAALQNKPKFTVNASRIETGEARMAGVPDSGKDPWSIGVAVSIPIWGERNDARVAEAEATHEAARYDLRAIENDTRTQVRAAYFRMANAERLIRLYEQSLIPQARQAMEVAEQWQDGETGDVSGFLETQSVWLNFNLARLRALTDYQQYRARLERLLGRRLDAVLPARGGAGEAANGRDPEPAEEGP